MKLFLSVGEKSAEKYAYLLTLELKKLYGNIEIFSFGSDLLATQSTKLADYKDISVIGFKEALNILPKAVKILNILKNAIINNNIEALILMDFPDFNLQLAKFAKKHGKKVIYYITPQVWAWRRSRVRQLFFYADLIIPILPFERLFFDSQSIKYNLDSSKVHYFGHPIIDILHSNLEEKNDCENTILILPGSRLSELNFHTKIFFEAAKLLKKDFYDYRFVVCTQKHHIDYLKQFIKDYPFIDIDTDTYTLMKKSKLAIAKSGTVTLEAALFDLPMVVSYRLSNLSYVVGKALIHGVNYIALPNVIYGKNIVPELIQFRATPKNIYESAKSILDNSQYRLQIKQQLMQVRYALGQYPVTQKIAKAILDFLS